MIVRNIVLVVIIVAVVVSIMPNIPYVFSWAGVTSSMMRGEPKQTVDCADSQYQLLCGLGTKNNVERKAYIQLWLDEDMNLEYQELPILWRKGMSDFVLTFPGKGYPDDKNCTVLSAHYDKAPHNQESEAGLDNTAGVYSLMLLAEKIKQESQAGNPPESCAIIVFSGEEETGWGGAYVFDKWITGEGIGWSVKDVLVVDSIGRQGLYVGATGNGTGIYFHMPFVGRRATNLHSVYEGADYWPINMNVADKLKMAGKNAGIKIKVYPDIVGWSEDEYYYKKGYDVVRVYGDDFKYYFNYIDTLDDKTENLDPKSINDAVSVFWEYINLGIK
ncbi:M28 family peptidase [Candidatus Woesearchaeota archaeon]|nr:M28 family peptidase [Candidatus Woesearchaeota archaeon]